MHIIGLEGQNSTAAEISALAKEHGMGYQLTIHGDIKGAVVTGIPTGFLFAADGKLASTEELRGKPLEDKIKELLKEAAGAMAGPGPYVKLAPLAAQIKTGIALGSVLKMLAPKRESKDTAEAAEAKMMYEALHGCAQDRFDNAVAKKEQEPVVALLQLDKLSVQFAGDEIGTKSKQEADGIRKDPKAKKEIEAEMMWRQLQAANDKLRPVRGLKNPADPDFRKSNLSMIQQIVGGCQALSKRYPGTAAAQSAEELMNEYH